METNAQIKTNLKQLRLSSFYEGFETHINDAVESKNELFRFSAEIDRRKIKKQENLIKRANLGRYHKLMEFDFHYNPEINKQQIMQFQLFYFFSIHLLCF